MLTFFFIFSIIVLIIIFIIHTISSQLQPLPIPPLKQMFSKNLTIDNKSIYNLVIDKMKVKTTQKLKKCYIRGCRKVELVIWNNGE